MFVTAPNSTIGGAAVNVQVTFITSLNQLEVQIQNLEGSISVETQAVSAVDWLLKNLDNSPTIQPSTITLVQTNEAGLGQVVNITSTTATLSALTTITNRWGISSSGQQIVGGEQISTFTGGSPSQLIIGPPPYNHPNAAITGHNPFLETDSSTHISYVLGYGTNSGVTANTVISQARLSFGTSFATAQELDLVFEAPEPGTVGLLLGGIALICLGLTRRRGKPDSPDQK